MSPSSLLYPNASEAEGFRQSEMRHALQFGGGVFLFALVLMLCAVAVAWMASVPLVSLAWVVGAIALLCGMLVMFVLFEGWRRGSRHVMAVVRAKFPEKTPEPAASVLPTLPTAAAAAENDAIRWTRGDRVEEIPRQLVHGFDPRDLWWLCKHIAAGNKFTESAMENIVLPYSGEMMGQAKPGTPYNAFMNLCVRSGVITDRGGAGNKAGTLAVTDANEILRLIKQQPE